MDYGFALPDEVFAMEPEARRDRLRGLEKVFVLDGCRGFVRTLLPVDLDHGSVQFGVWLEVPAEQADEAVNVWDEPAYSTVAFDGVIANRLAPWGDRLLGAGATARPRTHGELPFIDGGDDIVTSLLTSTWARSEIVLALPGLGHDH